MMYSTKVFDICIDKYVSILVTRFYLIGGIYHAFIANIMTHDLKCVIYKYLSKW